MRAFRNQLVFKYHIVTEIILRVVGLDTPFATIAQGYSTNLILWLK